MEIQLLGSQLESRGAHQIKALDEHAAAGLHAGGGESLNPKLWICEDSLVICRLPDGAYLTGVADSHWGGRASEVVAQGLRAAWDCTQGPQASARLHHALLLIEARMQSQRQPSDTSETTVLLAHFQQGVLSFASLGDSLLMVIEPGKHPRARTVNLLAPFYMGGFPLAAMPPQAVHSGSETVPAGQVVLLATDGLEPIACQLKQSEIAASLVGDAPLKERLEGLLLTACDGARSAGKDNLALVALQA